jgi:hypothetical protein
MVKRSHISLNNKLGLTKNEAARYIGVPAALFEAMVLDGRMPQPKVIGSCRVWSRINLRKAFAELPEGGREPRSLSPWSDCE